MGLWSENRFWTILVQMSSQAIYKSRTKFKCTIRRAQHVEITIRFFTKYLVYKVKLASFPESYKRTTFDFAILDT